MKGLKALLIIPVPVVTAVILVITVIGPFKETQAFDCQDSIGCVTVQPGEPVKIGVIQDLSGGASVFGEVQLNSILLALEERENQILGHPVKLLIEDEHCSEEGGKNAALNIVSDPQVVAILGSTCSGGAASASKIMSEAGLVMISGVNSAPSLTSVMNEKGRDWYEGYFRTSSNDSLRGRGAAVFVYHNLGITRVATIDDGDAYTRGSTDIFSMEFSRQGGEVVLKATIDKGDTDMKPVLTSVLNSGAQLIYFPLFADEGIKIVRQMREMDELEGTELFCAAPMLVPAVVDALGSEAEGIYGTPSTQPIGEDFDRVISAYEEKYGKKPASSGAAGAYDAVNILLNAIESIAVQEGDGTLHLGRQDLRSALYATKDYKGATGLLSCDEFGDCGLSRISIVRLERSKDGGGGVFTREIFVFKLDG